MLTPRDCPICNSPEKELVYRQRFSEFSEGSLFDGYSVVCCKECGFAFANDIPSQEKFDTYYKQMSKYENEYTGGQASPSAIQTYQAIVQAASPFLPGKDARILDVGCATGALLFEFKQAGYQKVIGLDPSPSCSRTAKTLYGIDVLNCALSEVARFEEPFDFIILNSVLEHIREIGESIQILRLLLKPNGMIWIEVPDVARFPDFVSVGFQQFSMEHINFFSATSLTNFMGQNGFSPLAIWHNNRQLEAIIDPALSTIYQKIDRLGDLPRMKDEISRSALVNYIEVSTQMDNGVFEKLEHIAQSQIAIIVWGVGTHTQRLLASSSLGKAKIRVFIDSNARYQGKMLNGIPIIAPDSLHNMPEPILISSRLYQEEIAAQIRDQFGLLNDIIRLY